MLIAPHVQLAGCLVPLSEGRPGIFATLRAMRRLINEGRRNLAIRQLAASLIFNVPQKNELREAQAIFDFVRNHIRYTRDIVDVETLATPEKTLEMRYGDCDDQTVLLAAMMESVGYPTRLVVASYDQSKQLSHVYSQVYCAGEWIDADPTEPHYFGWSAPEPTDILIEEM